MAYLTKHIFRVDGDDCWTFTCNINVNNRGVFTLLLPQDVAEKFREAQIDLARHPTHRNYIGFFSAATMNDLVKKVENVIADYTSRTLVSSKVVIRYAISTACAYSKSPDGDIVPNCSPCWVGNGDYKWIDGTVSTDALHPRPFGIQVFARVYRKNEYRYKNGGVKAEYKQLLDDLRPEDKKSRPNLFWLAGVTAICPPDDADIREVDYDEQVAGFFVETLRYICKINEVIKGKLEPETIVGLAHSKINLLGYD